MIIANADGHEWYILGPQPAQEGDEYFIQPRMVWVNDHHERIGIGHYPRRVSGEEWAAYYARCEAAAVRNRAQAGWGACRLVA